MTQQTAVLEKPSAKKGILVDRLHHSAQVVKDHEVTRQFYEDLLGLPLAAVWAEAAEMRPGEQVSFCHVFYSLADGGALAFFAFAKPEDYELYKATSQTLFNHFAVAVSREAQDEIQARLEGAGYPVRVTDHGYCRSLYVQDPDDWNLEFTSDPADAPQIYERQGREAHATLKRWIGGDVTPNNDLHHR